MANDVVRTLNHVLALRRVASAVGDPEERRRLERVVRDLRRSIGVGVPKRRAADALGVSVQALELWIGRGLFPTVRVPGSSRWLIDTEALIVLAEEVARIRESGRERGVLAAAFEELEREDRLPRRLRPNESARELRRAYLATTPAERLRDAVDLSHMTAVLAAHGAAARRRRREAKVR